MSGPVKGRGWNGYHVHSWLCSGCLLDRWLESISQTEMAVLAYVFHLYVIEGRIRAQTFNRCIRIANQNQDNGVDLADLEIFNRPQFSRPERWQIQRANRPPLAVKEVSNLSPEVCAI